MGGTINLRQARKRKRRAEREREAQQNRLTHGRRADERAQAGRLRELEAGRLEAHRREPSAESGSED